MPGASVSRKGKCRDGRAGRKGLFGTARPPEIDLELAKLTTLALAMVGHTSLSGV